MHSATVQQLSQNLPFWLALVQRGETIAIMDGGQEVAWRVPPETMAEPSQPVARG